MHLREGVRTGALLGLLSCLPGKLVAEIANPLIESPELNGWALLGGGLALLALGKVARSALHKGRPTP